MKKVLVLAMVLMLAASSAWAWDDAQHVKTAPNGKGDLIIFPFYFAANGGWQTKITVINTNTTTWSTVAKVVIRSNFYSQEVRDFLLFLTPSDVWTATITNDGTTTWLESTDDSMLAPNGQFASATNPAKIEIPNPTKCGVGSSNKYNVADSSMYGYIEVIEAWYGDLSNTAYDGLYQSGERRTRPVSKSFLYRVYTTNATPPIAPRMVGNEDTTDRTLNILSGYMEFQNSLVSGYTSSMRASVFADWDNTSYLTTSDVTGITLPSRNTIGELEAAMAKSSLVMPYVHQSADFTAHVLTFPTKVSNFEKASGDNYCRYIEARSDGFTLTPPYWDDPAVPGNTYSTTANYHCLTYTRSNYDLSEGSTSGPYSGETEGDYICGEVNILTSYTGFRNPNSSSIYTEGWTRYTFARSGPTYFTLAVAAATNPLDHTYFGTPVLPSVLMFKKGSTSLMEGSYTDGNVYGIATTTDMNADGMVVTTPADGIPLPAGLGGTALTTGSQPPYYDAAWPGNGWPAGGAYASAYAWLPNYQYSNLLSPLGRDSY